MEPKRRSVVDAGRQRTGVVAGMTLRIAVGYDRRVSRCRVGPPGRRYTIQPYHRGGWTTIHQRPDNRTTPVAGSGRVG